VAGLSFMVAFVNVIAVTTTRRLILEARVRSMRPHYDLTLTMAAIVGVLGFGIHTAQNPRPAKTLHIAALQANIPRKEKFDRQFIQKIFDQFTRLSGIALQSIRHLIC
jgi:apolipoprotein N-acyltransferase